MLTATLPASAASVLAVGATGVFTDGAGADQTASVTAIAPGATTDESVVTMTATGQLDPGASFVVRLADPSVEGGEHLLAPVAAIVTRGGRSYVYRRDGEVFEEVEVTVVGSAGGVAAIEPLADAEGLSPGTEVRVGTR